MREKRARRAVGALLALVTAALGCNRAPAETPPVVDTGAAPPVDRTPLVINTWSAPPTRDLFEGLVREAFRRIGREARVQTLPAERALLNANAGLDAGDGPRIAGLERLYPGLVRVPEALLRVEFVAFTRDPDLEVPDWSALAGLDVGLVTGWKILEEKSAAAASVTGVRTPAQLFRLLARRRIDVAIVGRETGLAAARAAGVDDVRALEPPLASRPMFLYVHRAHVDLVPPLGRALREMKRDGTFARLRAAGGRP